MDRKPIKLKNKIRNMSIEEVYQQFKNFIYKQCQSWLGKYEFDDLYQASCNLTECLRKKENLNDEELEEAGKLLQIVKDNYQKIIELIVQL